MKFMFALIHNFEEDRYIVSSNFLNSLKRIFPESYIVTITHSSASHQLSFFHRLKFLMSQRNLETFQKELWGVRNFHSRYTLSFFNYSINSIIHFGVLRSLSFLFGVPQSSIEKTRRVIDLNWRHMEAVNSFLGSDADFLFVFESDVVSVENSRLFEFLKRFRNLEGVDVLNLCNHFSLEEMNLGFLDLISTYVDIGGIQIRKHKTAYLNTTCAFGLSRKLCVEVAPLLTYKSLGYWPSDWRYNAVLDTPNLTPEVMDLCEKIILNGSLSGVYKTTLT